MKCKIVIQTVILPMRGRHVNLKYFKRPWARVSGCFGIGLLDFETAARAAARRVKYNVLCHRESSLNLRRCSLHIAVPVISGLRSAKSQRHHLLWELSNQSIPMSFKYLRYSIDHRNLILTGLLAYF